MDSSAFTHGIPLSVSEFLSKHIFDLRMVCCTFVVIMSPCGLARNAVT